MITSKISRYNILVEENFVSWLSVFLLHMTIRLSDQVSCKHEGNKRSHSTTKHILIPSCGDGVNVKQGDINVLQRTHGSE